MKAKHLFEILTPVILTLMICLFSKAQNQDNFFTICNQWDTYYQSHPELKDSAESEYLDYIRWKHFWKDRVHSSDSTKNGSFNLLRDAIDDYQNNYRYYHRLTNQYSDWRSSDHRVLIKIIRIMV